MRQQILIRKERAFKERPLYILFALGIILIIGFSIIATRSNQPETVPTINNSSIPEILAEENERIEECQTKYLEDNEQIKHFACKQQIGIEQVNESGKISYVPRYISYLAYEACKYNCTPVYYPGFWNCTFYQDKPDFPKLGNISVSHEGFSNWTYYPTRWSFNNLKTFSGRLHASGNPPLVCGYWVYDSFSASSNISGTFCDDLGEIRNITRKEPYDKKNYYCCFRPENYTGNYCYLIENVTEVMKCQCDKIN